MTRDESPSAKFLRRRANRKCSVFEKDMMIFERSCDAATHTLPSYTYTYTKLINGPAVIKVPSMF